MSLIPAVIVGLVTTVMAVALLIWLVVRNGRDDRAVKRPPEKAPSLDPVQYSLEQKLAARILDPRARGRLIEATKKRHPAMSQTEIIQQVLDELERDLRRD